MTDFDKWADEYLSNAEATMKLIEEYKKRIKSTKSVEIRLYYDRKLPILYDMYYDCMNTARELRKKAIRRKEYGFL